MSESLAASASTEAVPPRDLASALLDALAEIDPEDAAPILARLGLGVPAHTRPFLTKKDLAELFQVSMTSIDGLLSRGEIVPVPVGGCVRIPPAEVDRYLRERNGRRFGRRKKRIRQPKKTTA